MPKYSIVIPVYNCRQYLGECAESVLSQTVADFEALLIDDGSTDGSGELCEELSEHDGRIRVFHKENGGAASARNKGIEQAKGQYLMFIDGDDTIEKNCLELIDPVLSDDKCLPIFGMCFDYWKDGRIAKTELYSTAFPGVHKVTDVAKELQLYFTDNALSSACNKVFPSKLFLDKAIRFPETMALYEDLAFVLNCLPHFESVCVIAEGLYHYRNRVEETHIDQRVSDLNKMRTNLAPLNEAFCEFGAFADQSKMCATVSSNLYVMLLEHHLLCSRPSLTQMRKELPKYLSEEGFRKALCSGAELDSDKERLVDNTDRGKFIWIWMKYAGKRCKSKAKRFAKRLFRK